MEFPKIETANQVQAIQHFMMKMDIEMIDTILDSDKTYQDFEKYIFIDKLQKAFETFRSLGDTHLIAVEGKCNSCDKKKTGFTFVGNHSCFYMNVIFDAANNQINDLFECRKFKNKAPKMKLEERVYIDVIDTSDLHLPF